MELYETVLNNFAFVGLEWDESSGKYFFTKKYFAFQFQYILCSISLILFLVYDAKTFGEYTMGLLILFSVFACIIISVTIFLKVNMLFDYIANCKKMLKKSKSVYLLKSFL